MSLHPPAGARRLAPALAALVLLVGCAATAAPSPDSSRSERPARSDNPAQPAPSDSAAAVAGDVPDALLADILADAAQRSGVDVETLHVRRAEAMTWNDGSLGCPEPGMLYTQALVDGYHVVIDADGTELDYRATENGTFRICEHPGPPSGG